MPHSAVFHAASLAALMTFGPAAAAATPDPWARVPAFPTSCHQTADPFGEKLAAAHEAVTRDLDRQKAINDRISEELKSADPMELASRQQRWMMANPQKAMELMQKNQELGQTFSDTMAADTELRQKLTAELDILDARYQAAVDAGLAPVLAKIKDLEVRAGKDKSVWTEAGTYTGWALEEWNGLLEQQNTAYEKVCAEYWAASGPFHAWLGRFKEHLTSTEIPHREQADAVGAGFVAIMMSTPEATWQSTATLSALSEYMDMAARVFAKRWPEPRKNL